MKETLVRAKNDDLVLDSEIWLFNTNIVYEH